MKPSEELYDLLKKMFENNRDVATIIYQIHQHHPIDSLKRFTEEIKNDIKHLEKGL